MKKIKIHPSWKPLFESEFQKDYFQSLDQFIKKERKEKQIFPEEKDVFAAFENLNFDDVKVVILGQDPYHTPNMACGMAFCVPQGQKLPPSLKNIYKEIESDFSKEARELSLLKDEGVLFLNTVLTVEQGAALSHRKKGWERFTDAIIKLLWEREKKIVFLLWGKAAKRKKEELFKGDKGHLVLEAGHPSPLSARYFLGCRHFSKANAFLKKEQYEPIHWCKT